MDEDARAADLKEIRETIDFVADGTKFSISLAADMVVRLVRPDNVGDVVRLMPPGFRRDFLDFAEEVWLPHEGPMLHLGGGDPVPESCFEALRAWHWFSREELALVERLRLAVGFDDDDEDEHQYRHVCWPYSAYEGALCGSPRLWFQGNDVGEYGGVDCRACGRELADLVRRERGWRACFADGHGIGQVLASFGPVVDAGDALSGVWHAAEDCVSIARMSDSDFAGVRDVFGTPIRDLEATLRRVGDLDVHLAAARALSETVQRVRRERTSSSSSLALTERDPTESRTFVDQVLTMSERLVAWVDVLADAWRGSRAFVAAVRDMDVRGLPPDVIVSLASSLLPVGEHHAQEAGARADRKAGRGLDGQ